MQSGFAIATSLTNTSPSASCVCTVDRYGRRAGNLVIGHDRRRILHCNVTRQPDALWIVLHLREAWGYEPPHRFLIFDRDAKFSADVISTVKQNGTEPVRKLLFPVPGKRHRRALGRKCASRFAQPRDRSEPAAPEKTAEKLPPLLPRRSDWPRAREGHARRPSYSAGPCERRQGRLNATTRRITPPLHGRRLIAAGRESPSQSNVCWVSGESRLPNPSSLPNRCGRLTRLCPGFELTARTPGITTVGIPNRKSF